MPPGCLGSPRIELRGLSKVRNMFEIIQLYRAHQCLWNPRCKDYNNAAEIQNAWSRITKLMGGLFTTDEIKNVINNLREYYEDESELLEMKKQQGVKGAQPRHIYYYALKFLNTINTNAYESDANDNRKSNIDTEKKRNSKKRVNFGRKRIVGDTEFVEKQQSFLFESLSEYRKKHPVPLKCRVHQNSSNITMNMKQNLYSGMRNPEENSPKSKPVSMFLNNMAFGKPILETGLKNLSIIRDQIDTEEVAAEFLKANNKNQTQKFRMYENEIFPNIFQEVKIPEIIEQSSISLPHLSEQKLKHSVPEDSQSKSNKLIVKLMLFDMTTGKLSMVQDLKEENGYFKENTFPSPIPKFSSNRMPTVIGFPSKDTLSYHRANSGDSLSKPKLSQFSLISSNRKFPLLKYFPKSAHKCLTKTHQFLPQSSVSCQLLDTKSSESQVEVTQEVFNYVEPDESNVKILQFF